MGELRAASPPRARCRDWRVHGRPSLGPLTQSDAIGTRASRGGQRGGELRADPPAPLSSPPAPAAASLLLLRLKRAEGECALISPKTNTGLKKQISCVQAGSGSRVCGKSHFIFPPRRPQGAPHPPLLLQEGWEGGSAVIWGQCRPRHISLPARPTGSHKDRGTLVPAPSRPWGLGKVTLWGGGCFPRNLPESHLLQEAGTQPRLPSPQALSAHLRPSSSGRQDASQPGTQGSKCFSQVVSPGPLRKPPRQVLLSPPATDKEPKSPVIHG